jgi:hypothetical protein
MYYVPLEGETVADCTRLLCWGLRIGGLAKYDDIPIGQYGASDCVREDLA